MTDAETLELKARKSYLSLIGKAQLTRALFIAADLEEPSVLRRFFVEPFTKTILDNLARIEQLEGVYDLVETDKT